MMCGILLASVLFNIWHYREIRIVPCKRYNADEMGWKLQTSNEACEKDFLWGYSTFFLIGINNVAPFLAVIAANSYIIFKLRMKTQKNTCESQSSEYILQ